MIFVVGPTAVGKTDVGFLLAQKLGGEIISCDAMQVYREIGIATSKPPEDMRRVVAHHLIDVVSVSEEFDVAAFNRYALAAVGEVRARGKVPIIVGGSGMYMQVLLDGIFDEKAKDPQIRKELQQRLEQEGNGPLYEELKKADPAAAVKIHAHDSRRTVRALEVYYATRQPISVLQKTRRGFWGQAPVALFCLNRPRPELYERINRRVLEMFDAGLVDEIAALEGEKLSRTSLAIIGVKEVRGYLAGQWPLAQAQEQMQLNTRHLAKRQLTWFRKEKRLNWIEVEHTDSAQKIAGRISKEISR